MLFHVNKQQTSYGEDIGILLLDTETPFIQGDVGNAKSYTYPVRYKVVKGLTVAAIFAHDANFTAAIVDAAKELEREGVKAITGDCGFMALFQQQVKDAVNVPVFLSSLTQLPFITQIIRNSYKVGIITANSAALTPDLFTAVGFTDTERLAIKGLEDTKYFHAAAIAEIGTLDSDRISEEVVAASKQLAEDKSVGTILLECSLLPVYGFAVQQATGLPVFDFLTMIDYVQSSIVKRTFPDSY
ncbi:MAG: aspartate/glutamate racemase family protein [Desulfuromusa sp.]|nr:aspartate/glutamate racemase family protein [Desulfuromusa sp.]